MQIESTDLIVYTGYLVAIIAAHQLLKYVFCLHPVLSFMLAFPIGVLAVWGVCLLISFVYSFIEKK